jgi:hypothetical protein
MAIHSDLIPNYIESASPKGLRILMFKTNAKLGAECQYFDIQSYVKNGKTVWIAWFYQRLGAIGDIA